jgi:NAD-dependent deacetylase
LIAQARHLVAFTGAGVSAESGIPTFRGEDGLWKRFDPEKVASLRAFREDPTDYWRFSRDHRPRAAEPNPAHHALAELEKRGRLITVITQNTDGLHQRAGNQRVIELHGTSHRVRCLDCDADFPRVEIDALARLEIPPRCPRCAGRYLKPAVTFFGELPPQTAFAEANAEAVEADVMLVIGSSLQVHPAAGIPRRALEHGAELVVINPEPARYDERARCLLRGPAGTMLPALLLRL